MCLITKWKKPEVAKKDIICFKIMRRIEDTITSPFKFFEYELDKLYKTEMTEDPAGGSYDEKDGKELIKYIDEGIPFIIIGEGFHAALTIERLGCIGFDYVYKCIIPKNSLYYQDATGLIVANQIIIKEEVFE